jgi:hypothetical protein
MLAVLALFWGLRFNFFNKLRGSLGVIYEGIKNRFVKKCPTISSEGTPIACGAQTFFPEIWASLSQPFHLGLSNFCTIMFDPILLTEATAVEPMESAMANHFQYCS